MKCEEVEILLVDYLDNVLDEKTKAEVEDHLSSCGKCLDSFNESRKIMKVISKAETSQPDDSLKAGFYRMLDNEIRKEDDHHREINERRYKYTVGRKIFLAAAGFAILIAGTFLGMVISDLRDTSAGSDRIEMLQAQVDEMKKNAMFSMLREESSSYRLQGVNYAGEIGQKDDNVIDALINVLNTDKNSNVRLAAAFSLSKFTDNRRVCDSLVASLPRQTEPILQITLINILVDIREKSALRPIQNLVKDSKTLGEVRSVAERGTRVLML